MEFSAAPYTCAVFAMAESSSGRQPSWEM